MSLKEEWKKSMDESKLKYFVIKAEDLFELDSDDVVVFNDLLMKMENIRRWKKGKSASNNYYIVNRDEPYANEVKKIIEENEEIKL